MNETNGRRYSTADSRRMLRATADLQKQIAIAAGVHKSTTSRWLSGEVTSPVEPYSDLLDALARSRYTDPSPLVVHSMTVVEQALADEHSPEMLQTLLKRAVADEAMSQAVADIAFAEYCMGESNRQEFAEKLDTHIAKAVRVRSILNALDMQEEENG